MSTTSSSKIKPTAASIAAEVAAAKAGKKSPAANITSFFNNNNTSNSKTQSNNSANYFDPSSIFLSVVFCTAISTMLNFMWHNIFFSKAYIHMSQHNKISPYATTFSMSVLFSPMLVAATIIQTVVLSFMYAATGKSKSLLSLRSYVVPSFAVFHWSVHCLATTAMTMNEKMVMFVLLESCLEVCQFICFGVVLTLLHPVADKLD